MTNLRRGICGAPKVGSPLPTEFAWFDFENY
jgi:hypothetical protein